jgi:hypothetical protein
MNIQRLQMQALLVLILVLAACSPAAPTPTTIPDETLDWAEQGFRMNYPAGWVAEFDSSTGTYTLVQDEADLRRTLSPRAPVLLIGAGELGEAAPPTAAILQNFIALFESFTQPEIRPLRSASGYEVLIGRGRIGTGDDERYAAAAVINPGEGRVYLIMGIAPLAQREAFDALLLNLLETVEIAP